MLSTCICLLLANVALSCGDQEDTSGRPRVQHATRWLDWLTVGTAVDVLVVGCTPVGQGESLEVPCGCCCIPVSQMDVYAPHLTSAGLAAGSALLQPITPPSDPTDRPSPGPVPAPRHLLEADGEGGVKVQNADVLVTCPGSPCCATSVSTPFTAPSLWPLHLPVNPYISLLSPLLPHRLPYSLWPLSSVLFPHGLPPHSGVSMAAVDVAVHVPGTLLH